MKKANETVTNVVYANGVRVATLEQVNTRADDCAAVGALYYRLSDIYRRLETDGIDETERTALETDLAQVKAELSVALGYLEGYGE